MTENVDFFTLLNEAKLQNKPVDRECRLYYNKETGEPIEYSMESLEGDYIEVTKEQYAEGRHDVIIRNNKIMPITEIKYIRKLVPSNTGMPCAPSNVLIVDKTSKSKWCIKGEYVSND